MKFSSIRQIKEHIPIGENIFFWRARKTKNSELYNVLIPTEGVIKIIRDDYITISIKGGNLIGVGIYDLVYHGYHFYSTIEECIEDWNNKIKECIEHENSRHDKIIKNLNSKIILI